MFKYTLAEPAEEGFFRKLAYNFTSDFKCAAKIDELTKKLQSLSGEDEKKFLEIKIDFGMQDKKMVLELITFALLALDWSKKNLPKIEELLKGIFGRDKNGDEVREMFFQMQQMFEKKLKYDLPEYKNLMKNKTLEGQKNPSGKTLKELGYSKADILGIIKIFKQNASGQLDVLKKIRNKAHFTSEDATTIYLWMQPVIELLDMSIGCYKYVDYFLYYLSKEVM